MLSSNQIAYCAGLFEGEGYVGSCRAYKAKDGSIRARPRPTISVSIGMTDREPLEIFKNQFGGTIYAPAVRKNPRYKPVWRYQLSALEDVSKALVLMWPYLSPRRKDQIVKSV
jgi:hypothetical protein